MEANYEDIEGSQIYINENMICTAANDEAHEGFKILTLANGLMLTVKPLS